MSKLKSQRFSIRLLLDQSLIPTLNDVSKAHMVSRLALLRRYISDGLKADLETIQEGMERLKNIEATKRELSLRVKKHKTINEPLEY